MYQQVIQFLTDLWKKSKSGFIVAVLVSIVWYFVPRLSAKADKAQDTYVQFLEKDRDEWKSSAQYWQKYSLDLVTQQRDELKGIKDTVQALKKTVK